MPDPTGTDTESEPELEPCPEPEVSDIFLEVAGLGRDYQGFYEARCQVVGVEEGDSFDAFSLTCNHEKLGTSTIDVSFSNAAVLLPAEIQIDAQVGLRYVRAAAEASGQWLTVRDEVGGLLLAVVAGSSVTPYFDAPGLPEDFYAPLQIEMVGGLCPKGPGGCYELGEPAGLQFDDGQQNVTVLPLQVEQLSPLTIHAGQSWLSDPRSAYSCDGQSDDWAAFIVG